jgi:hypothetical protein
MDIKEAYFMVKNEMAEFVELNEWEQAMVEHWGKSFYFEKRRK